MADVCDDDGVSGENLVEEGDREIPFLFILESAQVREYSKIAISSSKTASYSKTIIFHNDISVEANSGVALTKTFLFVTNSNTPEGSRLDRILGARKEYKEIDKLDTLLTTGIRCCCPTVANPRGCAVT